MARSHGKILVDIWLDADWRTLEPVDQWTYLMLLSQPKLSLVGCLDYWPGRWATLAAGMTTEDVEVSIARLEEANYVIVDHDTGELLVRSMTRHDGLRTQNPKLMKGLWGQWLGIASANLRRVAVVNMPAALFDGTEPVDAAQIRRSAQMDCPIDAQSVAQSNLLPPSTSRHPPSSDGQSAQPVDNAHPPVRRIPADLRAANLQAARELKAARTNPAKEAG